MDKFITIGSFVFFTGLVAIITWCMTRKDDLSKAEGFFMAGRSLTFTVIAGSLLLTNLSTEQLVGINGSAFKGGLHVMCWEVLPAFTLVLMALYFLPRFLKAGISTIPEYLKLRFSPTVALISNLILLFAYVLILMPMILYTGGVGLNSIIKISMITGIEDYNINLWVLIWLVGIIGMLYALFGGLRSVAISDTINGIGLLIGGFMIVYYAFNLIGDGSISNGAVKLYNAMPERFNSIGGPNDEVPFSTLFTGVIIVNIFYWCTNQQIIQRALAAKSLKEGQKGVLLCGILKLLGPVYLVIPGMIAYYLFKDTCPHSDQAYGMLVSKVLPPWLSGFFAAVMAGAILSSFNSVLNSCCTLFSLGIYKEYLSPQASDKRIMQIGRIFGLIIAFFSMTLAPMLGKSSGIFSFLITLSNIYIIPSFALIMIGLLTKRVSAIAALVTTIFGVILMLLGNFVSPFKSWAGLVHPLHFSGIIFAILCIIMLIWGKISPNDKPVIIQDAKVVNTENWRYVWSVSIIMVVIMLTIYILFAKF